MGGFGSGRPQTRGYLGSFARLPIEALLPLLAHPDRMAMVSGTDGNALALTYRADAEALVLSFCTRHDDGQSVQHEQWIYLERQPRHFGGAQVYAHCPHCAQRCRVLRLVGTRLRCRHCVRLHYRVQSEDAELRATRAYIKVVRKLDATATIDDDIPPRPRRMRRTTYTRLEQQALKAWERREAAIEERVLLALARVLRISR